MNPFNKYETTGILISIIVMASALAVYKFEGVKKYTNTNNVEIEVVEDETTKVEKDVASLESTLMDAHALDGTLTKLVIRDIRLGAEGEAVKKGDTLVVHYVGTTEEGVRFDSSYERGETFTFTVGAGTVIQGWEEGLIGMRAGGQRVLVIPGDMAYGNRQVGVIPPNAPLIFAVELLEIK